MSSDAQLSEHAAKLHAASEKLVRSPCNPGVFLEFKAEFERLGEILKGLETELNAVEKKKVLQPEGATSNVGH